MMAIKFSLLIIYELINVIKPSFTRNGSLNLNLNDILNNEKGQI